MSNALSENLLNNLETVSKASANSNIDLQKLDSVRSEIETVRSFLDISPLQAVLFSVIVDLSLKRSVTLEQLSGHFECSMIKATALLTEIEALERKGFVKRAYKRKGRRPSISEMGFMVPEYIIDALLKGDSSRLASATKFDLPGFLKCVTDLTLERHENAINTQQLFDEVAFLVCNNGELPFVSLVNTSVDSIESKCTLFAISYSRFKGQVAFDYECFADCVFDDLGEQLEFCQNISTGLHELVSKGMIKAVESEFEGIKAVSLTPKIAKELYRLYPALLTEDKTKSGLISYKTIRNKKMLFSKNIQQQVDTLEEVLRPSKFRHYRKQLKRNGFSSGITAIFYGAPGTGKTEMVYQLARNTHRDIMMVDLTQTRSKWFGESEKLVQKIFDDYSALLNSGYAEPILFINEADGLFSKRIDLGSNGTSSDQANNTIQDVLLQALEKFEGILIATTNLTSNLDKAFERRFTFRIDFPKPDSRTRSFIWRAKLPELSEAEADILGEKFEFSGGEIDIHVRNILLGKVLKKNNNLFEALMASCKNMHGFTEKKKVGF